jgi:hypothetical protein
MALYHTNVLDNAIKALPTVGTAQGSVASFETDMTEDLIEVVCDIQYSQASGTPSPSNPLPITVYNALNLSHSGADTSNPTVYNIPFGQNVAKGTLNVTTGLLRLTHAYRLLDGNESWSMPATGFFALALGNLVNDNSRATIISNRFLGDSWTRITGLALDNVVGVVNGATIRFHYSALSDVASWKSWLGNNNTQICYELDTPQVIQLSATQITALLNENNIWHDCNGDTEVKYILSVGKAVT